MFVTEQKNDRGCSGNYFGNVSECLLNWLNGTATPQSARVQGH